MLLIVASIVVSNTVGCGTYGEANLGTGTGCHKLELDLRVCMFHNFPLLV